MTKNNILLEYFRLIRFSTVADEAGVILLGGFIMGLRDIHSLFILFLIGVCGHIFGYVLNEYMDVEIDRKLDYKIKKPLVSGIIPKKNALIIVFISGLIAFMLTFYYFFNYLSILLLAIAAILTIIYDTLGKKIPFSDFVVAGTLFVFIMFGASVVSTDIPKVVILAGLIFFFDVVFMNFVEGGIKDVDHDSKAGGKTMATRLGVMIKDEKLVITNRFRVFALVLRMFFYSLVIMLGLQPEISLWTSEISVVLIVAILLMIIVALSSTKLLFTTVFDKSKLFKLFTLINSCSVILLLVVLFPLLEIYAFVFLLLLPITWFVVFNLVLYKRPFQPLV